MSIDLVVENIPSRMSFSRYWESRTCVAAGLPTSALRVQPFVVSSKPRPQILIGRFFHSLVKAVATKVQRGPSKEESLIDVFPKVVKAYRERYPRMNLDFDPLVQRIYNTVRSDIDFGVDDEAELYVEIEVSSADSLLFGTPDWVMTRQNEIQLIDFKLTAKTERLLTDKSQAQLAFYSYLVMETYGRLPADIQLVGLNGAKAQVRVSLDEAEQVAEDARECLRLLTGVGGASITLEDFATPSPISCAQCRYREICGAAVLDV